MFKILIALFAILLLVYLKNVEPFETNTCNTSKKRKSKIVYDKCIKKETIDSVTRYPSESMDPLFDASFKPECCPSTYTTSSGCLCYESKNFDLLASRGGNAMTNPL